MKKLSLIIILFISMLYSEIEYSNINSYPIVEEVSKSHMRE